MATIVQDYGPIYGEVVNGTVQGRPNGSVYVPISNRITISLDPLTVELLFTNQYNVGVAGTDGLVVVAEAQDLASYVQTQLYADVDCTTLLGSRSFTAGLFNFNRKFIGTGTTALTPGDTYYVRAQLMNNGDAVATSDVIEVVAS